MEAGGSRYMLSTVLGVTDGGDRGNTVREILEFGSQPESRWHLADGHDLLYG